MNAETVIFGLQVIARVAWYVATFALLGSFGVDLVAARVGSGSDKSTSAAFTKRVALLAALLLVVITIGRLFLQTYAVFGMDEGVTAEGVRVVAFETSWGAGWRWQIVAAFFAIVMTAIATHRTGWLALSGLAALFVCITVPLTGHAVAESWPGLWVSVQAIHVAGAGVWLGTLSLMLFLLLSKTTRVAQGSPSTWVDTFSPLALTGASIVMLSGLLTTVGYLDAVSELWATAYGRVLVLKVVLVGAVVGCGAFNWRRVRPRLPKTGGLEGLRRWVLTELAFAALVIVVTAALVALNKGGE